MKWDDLTDEQQLPFIMMAIVSGYKSPLQQTAKFLWESDQKEQAQNGG